MLCLLRELRFVFQSEIGNYFNLCCQTRVNALSDANEYMVQYSMMCSEVLYNLYQIQIPQCILAYVRLVVVTMLLDGTILTPDTAAGCRESM